MQRVANWACSIAAGILPLVGPGGVAASTLPAIVCAATRPPAATCAWQPGGSCSWEEGGTPVTCAPATGAQARLRPAGTYRGGYFNASAANGVAFDKATQRLFVANSRTQSIDVISLSGGVINPDRPSRLTRQFSINVAALLPVIPVNAGVVQSIGAATPTSIVVQNGLLAVVLQHGQEPTRRGKVAFYRAAGSPSDPALKVIDVGFMPAEATFTPNGLRLLVANEGEPTQDYRTDPLGSVSIIDLTGGVANARATQVDFSAWNSKKADLVRRGVRITGPNLATADPRDTASVARDFEPTDTAIRPTPRWPGSPSPKTMPWRS